jgi:hypothetical protein
VPVTFHQGSVPLHAYTAKAFVFIAFDGKVRSEEDGEIDVRFARDAAQQRRLILDRMAYEVSQSDLLRRSVAVWQGEGIHDGSRGQDPRLWLNRDEQDRSEAQQCAEAA